MTKKLELIVFGEVIGVNFRAMAKTKAKDRNIRGYVINMDNGKVKIEAEGEDDDLKTFILWIKSNPGYSKVTDTMTRWGTFENEFNDFEIRI